MREGHNVVVVHDYLTQRGGAERVVLEMMRAYPNARLVTSCWNPATTFEEFADYDVQTLWPNRFKSLRQDPRRALPVLARTFASHHISDADVVICSSSGWAHRVSSSAPRIVYCHNPARWLYQPDDYFVGTPQWLRRAFARRSVGLQRSDVAAARSAAAYLVNSTVVADRVASIYGLEPTVVAPPRGLSPEGPHDPIAGIEPGFLLTVSRRRGYKHTNRVVEAVNAMPGERLVVVGGDPERYDSDRVRVIRNVSDAGLRWLYTNAGALVAMAHEDFGLTPVEAQAHGTPTLALRAGGYLDTTVEDETGLFVDSSGPADIADGIARLRARTWDTDLLQKWGDRYAPETFKQRLRAEVDAVAAPRSAGI